MGSFPIYEFVFVILLSSGTGIWTLMVTGIIFQPSVPFCGDFYLQFHTYFWAKMVTKTDETVP